MACGCWCDSMSRSWVATSQRTGIPLHYFDVPRFDAETKEWAIDYLTRELESLVTWLGTHTGKRITKAALTQEIRSQNALRQAMVELTDLLREDDVVLPALEYYLLQLAMSDNLQAPGLP